MIQTLCVIGVGLIGGSFARALRQTGAVNNIIGFDANTQALHAARDANVIDRIAHTITDAVSDADVVVIAVPVRSLAAVLTDLKPSLPKRALLMDVGSTKCDALASANVLGGQRHQFVPAHPIAGREKSGVDATDATLFQNRYAILTPDQHTNASAIARATQLWEKVGARVLKMSAEAHDEIFAAVSHLPHMLAFALVTEFAGRANASELFKFAASGFRDFTRIAASSPEMWRDVALTNRTALLAEMKQYRTALDTWIDCVERADGEALAKLMSISRDHRERWGRGEFNS